MNSSWTEEKKASIDGIEIPIQCILLKQSGKHGFSTPHYHDYVEILYGLTGNVQIWLNGKTMVLSAGTMIVINSRTAHTVAPHNGQDGTYIVIKYMPQVLYAAQQSVFEFKYVVPFMMDSDTYTNFFDGKTLATTEIPDAMQKIYDEWESRSYGYEIALRIYVLKISLWLVRYWHKEIEFKFSDLDSGKNLMHSIAKAMEYAQKNYSTATASLAAEAAELSYSYFSRVFKRIMNRSFNEYLTYIRISEAKRMLICTNDDITKIAMDTGFATSSYFIEKFKKQDGITPNKFRAIYRKSTGQSV